jgi:hypothetical protein
MLMATVMSPSPPAVRLEVAWCSTPSFPSVRPALRTVPAVLRILRATAGPPAADALAPHLAPLTAVPAPTLNVRSILMVDAPAPPNPAERKPAMDEDSPLPAMACPVLNCQDHSASMSVTVQPASVAAAELAYWRVSLPVEAAAPAASCTPQWMTWWPDPSDTARATSSSPSPSVAVSVSPPTASRNGTGPTSLVSTVR